VVFIQLQKCHPLGQPIVPRENLYLINSYHRIKIVRSGKPVKPACGNSLSSRSILVVSLSNYSTVLSPSSSIPSPPPSEPLAVDPVAVTVGVVPIDPDPISLPSVPIIDRRGELILLVLALIALLVYDELGEGEDNY